MEEKVVYAGQQKTSLFQRAIGKNTFLVQQKIAKRATKFFAYFFHSKIKHKPTKKYRAVIFYEIGDHMQKFSSFG